MLADSIFQFAAERWLPIIGVLVAAYLARNRYHNGLNKYPGPFLASLTDWWRFWDVWGRLSHITHIRLHEEHGDFVRLGPNVISIADPKAVKAIYGLNKGMYKSDFYVVQQAVSRGRAVPSLFSTTDNDFHARFRRGFNAAFSMSAIVQYEQFVDNTTRLLLEQTEKLYARTGAACGFTTWLQFYAFDVIGEITYSTRHGFLERNEDVDGIVAYLGWVFDYSALIGQIPILDKLLLKNPILMKLAQWGIIDATSGVTRFANARIEERGGVDASVVPEEKRHKSPDLLSKFIAARAARPDLVTEGMVRTMAQSMAFAGSETTAISLAAAFYHLMRNPSAMARLQQEIDDMARRGHFKDTTSGLVTWQESLELPYLDAVVKEAFRVHPAAGLPYERIVPKGGAEIAGRFIPTGTIVGVNPWVLHRNKDIFGEDAAVFRPERWLVDEEKVAKGGEAARQAEELRITQMNAHMMQFGMGSRTCIGKNISLLEMYKAIPAILRRFEVKFQDPSQEWKLNNSWFVKQFNFFTTFEMRELVQPENPVAS